MYKTVPDNLYTYTLTLFTYNIINYDYNRDAMCLKTTHHYYEMMDKIFDISQYLPNNNINLFIHMF